MTLSKLRRIENMTQIRKRLVDGQDNDTIAKELGLNRRTYFRLVKRIFDSDRKRLEKQDATEMMREASIMLERYNDIYRQLKQISEDPQVKASDRMFALAAMSENARARVNFFRDSPALPMLQRRRLEALMNGALSFGLRSNLPQPLQLEEEQQEEEPASDEEDQDIFDHEFTGNSRRNERDI
jgi:hypothetical protein